MAPFDPKSFLSEGEGGFDPKAFLAEGEEKPKEERGGIKEVVRPFTTYGQAQHEKQREARQGITQGIERLTKPTGGDVLESVKSAVLGPAEILGGAVGYVASPLTGAYRSFVSRPVEEMTGLPKEYTEFGMEMATPVLGMTKTPRIPIATRAPKKGPEAEASRIFEKQIEAQGGSPQTVRERLEAPTQPREIVPGSEPTTFQLTGDPGLGQVERGAQARNAGRFNERAAQQNLKRVEAIEEAQPTGSPVDVAAHARRAQENEARILEGEVQAADQRAREAARLPGGGVDPATHGNVMRQELENAADAERAREGTFWRQVDPNGVLRLDPNPLQRVEREIYGVMPEGGAAEASLSAAEKQISEIIQNYPPNIPLRELNDLNGLLSSRMREELWQNGRSLAYGRMSRLRQGIADAEEGVFGQLGERDATLPQRLREARDATRQRAERFNQAPISDVLQRQGTQGPYKVQPSQITDKLLPQGNKGYDVAQSYLRASPQSLDVYTEALSAKMAREVIGPDGAVDPRRLEGFIRRHDGILRAITERDGGNFVRSLQNIQATQERLAAVQASRQAFSERFASEELGKLIGATDAATVENIIGSIFNRYDAVPRAQELARLVAGNPAAQDGLRRAVINHINQRFIGTMEAGNTEQNLIRASMFQKFIRDKAPVLQQLMTPEQLKVLEAVASDITRTNRTIGTKIPGGSNTVQDLYNLEQQGWLSRMGISKFGGFLIKKMLKDVMGPVGGRAAYEVGAAGLGAAKERATAERVAEIQRMIDRAMLDPDYAKELLSKGYTTVVRPGARARASGGSVFAAGGFGGQPRDAPAFGGTGQARPGAGQAPQNGRSQTYQAGGTVVQISKRADGGDVESDKATSKAMPTDEDVALSQKYDRTYGDPVASYIKPGGANVNQLPIPDVETAINRGGKLAVPAGMGTPTPVSPEEADRIHRGWMAAERSAVAKLGFQPRNMSVSPPAGPQGPRLTAFGLYDPNTNQSWYDANSPTSAVHESMHRGLQKLREAGVFPKGLPEEELFVRAMMDRHLTEPTTDPVTGRVYDNRVKQLSEAKRRVRAEDLDAIENAAAWLVAKKHPGGPRADGGSIGEAQQAQPHSGDRFAQLMMGQTGGQNFAQLMAGKKTKAPTGVSREDIVRTLRGRGLSGEGWEAPSGTDYESRLPAVDSRATGGSIEDEGESFTQPLFTDKDTQAYDAANTAAQERAWGQHRRDPGERPFKVLPPEMTPEEVERNEGWRGPTGRRFLAGGGLIRSGIESILMPTRRAATRELSRPVRDLPQKTLTVGGEPFTPRPSPEVRQLAQQYMEEKGLPYRTLENYVPVDVPRAKAIAREYDIMPHIPDDPSIQRAYDALARETRDQYEMLQRAGKYKFEPFKPGPVGSDPYAANPRLAQKDFLENRHMYYFPSEQGFGLPGEEAFAKANPMMKPSGVKIEGKEVPFNDLFRVVHDVFGHHKEGFGFRAAGEENAWRSHGRMYSPEALPAMTAETRGQNSWVNFGPHAEFNKTASGADTIYAPQKIGRLPDWIIHSGRLTPLGIAGLTALPEGEPEPPEKKAEGGLVQLAGDVIRLPIMPGPEAGYPTDLELLEGRFMRGLPLTPQPSTPMWQRLEEQKRRSPGPRGRADGGETEEAEGARTAAAARTARAVQPRSITGQSEGRPGEDVDDPWAMAKQLGTMVLPTSPTDLGLMVLGGPLRWPLKAAVVGLSAAMHPSEAEAGKLAAAKKLITRPAIHTEPQMFDYSRLHETPNVPQFDLERYVPPRGVPETATSLATPENIARINSVVRQGAKAGGLEWYNTMPLREAFIAELGPEKGPVAFQRYMDYVASTSPHSAVPINVRNASYYYGLGQRGDPMPTMHIEQVLNKRGVYQPKWKLDEPLPSPYGHEAQTLHVQNATNVLNQGGIPLVNQKPASFSQNLQGNWRPVTIDTHNARLIGLPRDAPSKTEYGFLEAMQQREAERLGMTPAQYQASAWIGGGEQTGLRSAADPFLRVFEQRVRLTAEKTGVPPEQVLRRFIRGEMPLLKFGGGV